MAGCFTFSKSRQAISPYEGPTRVPYNQELFAQWCNPLETYDPMCESLDNWKGSDFKHPREFTYNDIKIANKSKGSKSDNPRQWTHQDLIDAKRSGTSKDPRQMTSSDVKTALKHKGPGM